MNNEWDRIDADIEQAQLEALGRRVSLLRHKGICVHGWRQGFNGANTPHLKPGQTECLYCHKVATVEELDADRDRYL